MNARRGGGGLGTPRVERTSHTRLCGVREGHEERKGEEGVENWENLFLTQVINLYKHLYCCFRLVP